MPSIATPALVLTHSSGVVLEQNGPARRLLGDGVGKLCWDFFHEFDGAEDLPCNNGCAGRLLRDATAEGARRSIVRMEDRPYELTCMKVSDDKVACLLHPTTCQLPKLYEQLTPRERDVLRLIADGQTTAEAADELGIKEATVRTYVEHMRHKLGVGTRAGVVARAFRLGLID